MILHLNHAAQLLQSGHAYRCFCSLDRLDELARERRKLGFPTDYDRKCLDISSEQSEDRASKGEAHVVRLKMPGTIPVYKDLVYGEIAAQKPKPKPSSHRGLPSFDDPVLVKSDGVPTYHLANVVDDHHMQISHVIRAAVSPFFSQSIFA